MQSARPIYREFTALQAADYDFSAPADGLPAVYPDWVELPDGGTLTFLDRDGVSRTLSSAEAGYRNSIAIRKIVTLVGADIIRLGSGVPPGATGATGAAADDMTITAIKAGSYTAVAGEFVRVSTAAARAITLPTAVGVAGQQISVKDVTGAGAGTNNITVDGTGGQTIDGAASLVMATNKQSVTFISDGANWLIKTLT